VSAKKLEDEEDNDFRAKERVEIDDRFPPLLTADIAITLGLENAQPIVTCRRDGEV